MEINRVGVLGCGLMGSGIAQTAAAAGCEVLVREVTQDLCDRGFAGIEKSLAKFAEKGSITAEQQSEIRGRIKGTTSLEDLADCDIIIEAIVENLEAKRDTYNQLDGFCKPETIFASNTSSLSITEMMTATRPERQARFVGLDTTYYIAEIMFDEFREKRFAPPPLLKRMVKAGLYGRKTGRGFYDYADPKQPVPMSLV